MSYKQKYRRHTKVFPAKACKAVRYLLTPRVSIVTVRALPLYIGGVSYKVSYLLCTLTSTLRNDDHKNTQALWWTQLPAPIHTVDRGVGDTAYFPLRVRNGSWPRPPGVHPPHRSTRMSSPLCGKDAPCSQMISSIERTAGRSGD